jgi:hypothetical protein
MSTTEETQTSKDRGVIQVIGFKEFSSICDEYQIVEKATKELLEIANDVETPVRTRVDIYKWVVEMNIGKPKQMNDIVVSGTTKPEVSFDIFNPKTYLGSDEKEKLSVVFNTNLGSENIVKAMSKKYSIPYEEVEDFEKKVGFKVNQAEYQNPDSEIDVDKILQEIEEEKQGVSSI